MKNIPFKTILFLAVVPLLLWGHTPLPHGKFTKEKTIKKEFNVNATALLKVHNSYGNLNITSWNENRVVIEVHIKTTGNNEEKVARKLEEITVDFESDSDLVSAKTNFGNSRSSWGWNWGKNNNVNMQVNYTIKVPIKNSVTLDNDYGNISIDRIDGHAKIHCDYGRLNVGELWGRNNSLNFDYTSKSTFGFVNSAEIRADYSSFTIEKAGNLKLLTDYTDATILEMENLEYTSDYGKIEVKEAKHIKGTGDYITVRLGVVHGDVDITADYGSLRIDEMAQGAGNITMSTDYTGIKIGYHPNYHFNFNISTSYAGVSGKDPFQINISTEKSSSRHYEGYYGSPQSGNDVILKSDYGSINFTQL